MALALAAAGTWAVYSIVTKKLSTFGYDSILVTRRTFAWGLAFMLPALPLLGFSPDWGSLAAPEMWGNLVFLGLGASALCFVTWNMAVKELGPVKTSLYIYLVPALTVLASAAVLGDPLTPPPPGSVAGVLLTIAGLFLSERGRSALRGGARVRKATSVAKKASDSEVRKGFEGAAQAAFPHSARSQKGSRGIAPVHPREARGFLPNSICFLHYTSNRLHGDARDWAASSEGFHRTSFVEWKNTHGCFT